MPKSVDKSNNDDPVERRAQEIREELKRFGDEGEGVTFDLRGVDPFEREAILRVVGLDFDALVSAHHPSHKSHDETEQLKAEFRRIVMAAKSEQE